MANIFEIPFLLHCRAENEIFFSSSVDVNRGGIKEQPKCHQHMVTSISCSNSTQNNSGEWEKGKSMSRSHMHESSLELYFCTVLRWLQNKWLLSSEFCIGHWISGKLSAVPFHRQINFGWSNAKCTAFMDIYNYKTCCFHQPEFTCSCNEDHLAWWRSLLMMDGKKCWATVIRTFLIRLKMCVSIKKNENPHNVVFFHFIFNYLKL